MKTGWLILALLAGFAVPFVVPALADNRSVEAKNNFFDPMEVAVKPGEKVTFSNNSGTHNVVWEDGAEGPAARRRPAAAAGAWRRRQAQLHQGGEAGAERRAGIRARSRSGAVPADPPGGGRERQQLGARELDVQASPLDRRRRSR